MSCIDGFVLAVPNSSQQKFIAHANQADSVFIEHGAGLVRRCTRRQSHRIWPRRECRGRREDRVSLHGMAPARSLRRRFEKDEERRDHDVTRGMQMPFGMDRMVFGGFTRVVTLEK